MSLLEQRRDFIICESGDATTDAGNEERLVLMLLGKLDELINVGFDGFHTALHRWDGITLALQTHALAHNSPKLAVGDVGRTAAVHTFQVASEHKNLVRLQLCNKLWCSSLLFQFNLFFV